MHRRLIAALAAVAVALGAVAPIPRSAGADGWADPTPTEVDGVDAPSSTGDVHAARGAAPGPVKDIVFPVAAGAPLSDDFGDARSGHTHQGNDLLCKSKGMAEVAAVDGVVAMVTRPEASYGYSVVIQAKDGWTYHYLHVNNDTPGTDDGKGGEANAFPAWVVKGATVRRGETIAYCGDSGNAESVGPHLHFEIHPPNADAVNPYQSLKAAKHIVVRRLVPRTK